MTEPTTDVPLICDEPPRGIYAISFPGRLHPEQVERIKQAWEQATKNTHGMRVFVLEQGATLEAIGPQFIGWPDAEHCAA